MRNGDALLTITIDVPEACITLCGELDFVTAPAVGEAAAMLLSGTAPQITLDLGGLQFVDAAGLGQFVRLRQTLAATGRELRLRRPSARVVRTFAAGGLRELLEPDAPAGGGRSARCWFRSSRWRSW